MTLNSQISGMTIFSVCSRSSILIKKNLYCKHNVQLTGQLQTDCLSLVTKSEYRMELIEQFSSKGPCSLIDKVHAQILRFIGR